MAHKKPHLPEKTCPACQRTFTWRRKWAANWEEVRFCSGACRTGKRAAARGKIGKGA